MELTRYDRQRLGQLVGALALFLHAGLAGAGARMILGLPMEAGGLFLGPVIGGPLAIAAVTFLALGVLLASGRTTAQAAIALTTCVFADVLLWFAEPLRGWLVAGAVLGVTSLVLFLSTVDFRVRGVSPTPRTQSDQVALGVVCAVLAMALALFLAGLAT